MSRYKVEPLDLSRIATYPLASRPSKVTANDFAQPVKAQSTVQEFLHGLPNILAARDLRQLADALAKGKVAIAFGLGRSQTEPFIKAGLPLKPAPVTKEGLPASNAFGVIGVIKDPPHPSATKVFINWFLSREGQDWYGRIMQNGTRRLDVDTKWLKESGISAAKDALTVQEYHRVRNHLEDKYTRVRVPAGKFAETILK